MRISRTLPQSVARGLELIFDREQPWRKEFLVLRALEAARGADSRMAARARARFESRLMASPEGVVPYLEYLGERVTSDQVKQHGHSLALRPDASAGVMVEVAKFHYLNGSLSVGDALLERAKEADPGLARIYDEEAWNQRARGNLHRELQAVEHSIELAADDASKLTWRGWRMEVLVRLGRLDEAWQEFSTFPPLGEGNEQLLTAAYCARQLGMDDHVARLYRSYAPTADGFDVDVVASVQFEKYQRADEVAALLTSLDHRTATRLLDLSFRARVQLGDLECAIAHAQIAMHREDCPKAMRPHLGQLLELLDRPAEAVEAYRSARPKQRSLLHRFRLATLLSEHEGTQSAVESYFEELDLPRSIPTSGADDEVDPQLRELLDTDSPSLDSSTRIELLEQIALRASSRKLRWQAFMQLAQQLALRGDWDSAWASIRSGQYKRLPAIQLTLPQWSDLGSSRNSFYHECFETEPLQPRTVLYESSLGASTSCNPLAICRELLDDPEFADAMHVWSIDPNAQIHETLLGRPNVLFVRKGSSGHFRYLACAGTVVNNSTIEHSFIKRPGQRYLNTWHGVPWKTMGRDNRSEPFAYGNIARNFLHADIVLGPDAHTLAVLSRGHDVDQLAPQVFTRGGYPRNDLAVNLPPETRHAIRTSLGVGAGEALVVYMPTWKGTFTERSAEVQDVLQTASGLAAPGLRVAVRAHHYVSSSFKNTSAPSEFVFVPPHIDTNELIGAADAIVTDFSSVLFDAAAVGVPVVKLTAGLDAYDADRGLYFSADEVPGRNAETTDEARAHLLLAVSEPHSFMSSYAEQTARFSFPETGRSARQAIELLFADRASVPANPAHRSVLLSTGGLPPNGITRSMRSLIASLDGTEYQPYLIPNRNALEGSDPETLADVRAYARVLPMVGIVAGTRMEREVMQFFSSRRYIDFPLVRRFLQSAQRREARRLFGDTSFYAAVEFSAYDSSNIALIGHGVQVGAGRRGIIFHNEMWKEVENKYPRLRPGLLSMDAMDFLASVSDGVREYNARTMHDHLGIPAERHITIENTINVAEIRALAATPLDAEDLEWYQGPGAHACVVARLSHEKNHAELFRALAACRDELTRPVKLTCLGDGPLRLELQQLAASLGIDDLVRLRGLVPNPQAHLRAAEALVLPSLHEGQPLVLLEALTIGTPVVATDTPGSRSALHGGAFGPLVPISQDGMREALHRVSDRRLEGTTSFDAEAFTQRSLEMFLHAIDPERVTRFPSTQGV